MILIRPFCRNLELVRNPQHPLGLSKELPRRQHKVGRRIVALLYQVVRRLRIRDEARGADQQAAALCADGLANLARNVRLVRPGSGYLLLAVVAAAADVEHVDTERRQLPREPDAAVDVPRWLARPLHPLGARDAQPQRHRRGDDGANGGNDLA